MSGQVLVTGGAGFIGSYVVDELATQGYQPVVFDRRSPPASPGISSIFGDVTDRVAVESAVYGRAGVIHLAGILGTQETVRHPHPSAATNVMGTLNVLAACEACSVPLVVISVGNWWMCNPYSITKRCAEMFAMMYRQELGMPVSVVRALNAYGPRQSAMPIRKIIPTFVNACLDGQPIEIYGSGEQVMDMIHVKDVARILVRALDRMPSRLVEAGTGRAMTVNEIAEAVIEAVGRGTVTNSPMRPGEEPESVVLADVETLSAVGIDPLGLVALEEGLVETIEYFRGARV